MFKFFPFCQKRATHLLTVVWILFALGIFRTPFADAQVNMCPALFQGHFETKAFIKSLELKKGPSPGIDQVSIDFIAKSLDGEDKKYWFSQSGQWRSDAMVKGPRSIQGHPIQIIKSVLGEELSKFFGVSIINPHLIDVTNFLNNTKLNNKIVTLNTVARNLKNYVELGTVEVLPYEARNIEFYELTANGHTIIDGKSLLSVHDLYYHFLSIFWPKWLNEKVSIVARNKVNLLEFAIDYIERSPINRHERQNRIQQFKKWLFERAELDIFSGNINPHVIAYAFGHPLKVNDINNLFNPNLINTRGSFRYRTDWLSSAVDLAMPPKIAPSWIRDLYKSYQESDSYIDPNFSSISNADIDRLIPEIYGNILSARKTVGWMKNNPNVRFN